MATAAKNTKAEPLKTKTGRIRLGPLNIAQLNELLANKSVRPRDAAKYRNRIRILESRQAA